MADSQMKIIQDVFQKTDPSGEGLLSRDQLRLIMIKLNSGLTQEQCDSFFRKVSGGKDDGFITQESVCEHLAVPKRRPAVLEKPIFFDMKHSNNAARVRLWLMLKDGMQDAIEHRMLTYPELKMHEYAKINPLKKVPAFIKADSVVVFESQVILDYLEDKYRARTPCFKPSSSDGRQLMNLIIRCHDIYIASPNCTEEGFSHTQGCMYLSYGWHGKARGMDIQSRALKIAEIWKQLAWLNSVIVGPYLADNKLTLADMTWFPTTIFMEFMLPRVFGWPDIFRETKGPFPAIAKWWIKISEEPAFAYVRQQIFEYWEEMWAEGQFKPIIDEIKHDTFGYKWKYP